MSEYRIFETDEFLRQLEKLTKRDAALIERKLASHVYPQLKGEPVFGPNIKKLRGYVPDTWRYRIRRFRVFYGVNEEACIVHILTIDQRKDAYR